MGFTYSFIYGGPMFTILFLVFFREIESDPDFSKGTLLMGAVVVDLVTFAAGFATRHFLGC